MSGGRGVVVPSASPERIARRLERLATFVEPARPYTRRAFTDVYATARRWLAEEFRSEGLACALDAAANLVGRTGDDGRPAIVLGSHIDTVVGGGRYDGMAGVVCALEVASVLREAGLALRHPLEVVDFLSEEPSDYGASCIGSRAMAGTLTARMLEGRNSDGETLHDAIARMGGRPERLGAPLVQHRPLAFIELHVEQGTQLEAAGVPVGIVTGIVAVRRARCVFVGAAAHAGTTAMGARHDALVAAARFVVAVHDEALLVAEREPFVATVGRLAVEPNAANVVPGRVELVLETRAMEEASLDGFHAAMIALATSFADRAGVAVEVELVSTAAAAACDPTVRRVLREAADRRGIGFVEPHSGAGHDAMQMALVAPMGMLFVPSRDGVSHTPEEHTDVADLAAGANVLVSAVLALDEGADADPSEGGRS